MQVEKILGFDYGTKYIGVASGQTLTKTATPICSIRATSGTTNWPEIAKLINNWQPDKIVVGLPLNMDGTKQVITIKCEKFGKEIEKRFNIPVFFTDERLSTWEAKQTLSSNTRDNNKLKKKDFSDLNALAAKILLEQWLQQNH
jgi:putative holliday junction resolvase